MVLSHILMTSKSQSFDDAKTSQDCFHLLTCKSWLLIFLLVPKVKVANPLSIYLWQIPRLKDAHFDLQVRAVFICHFLLIKLTHHFLSQDFWSIHLKSACFRATILEFLQAHICSELLKFAFQTKVKVKTSQGQLLF